MATISAFDEDYAAAMPGPPQPATSAVRAYQPSDAEVRKVFQRQPDQIQYGARLHPDLRIVIPFRVLFEKSATGVAAVVPEVSEYGVGASRSEALDDLGRTLAELYFSLERDEHRLSPDLASVRAKLTAHLVRIDR